MVNRKAILNGWAYEDVLAACGAWCACTHACRFACFAEWSGDKVGGRGLVLLVRWTRNGRRDGRHDCNVTDVHENPSFCICAACIVSVPILQMYVLQHNSSHTQRLARTLLLNWLWGKKLSLSGVKCNGVRSLFCCSSSCLSAEQQEKDIPRK